MNAFINNNKRPRDLLSLMSAPVSDLLDELAFSADGSYDEPGIPRRAVQLADMLVEKVIYLIRYGTSDQLSRAAEDFADAILDPSAEQLAQRTPEAHELLMAGAVMLQYGQHPRKYQTPEIN